MRMYPSVSNKGRWRKLFLCSITNPQHLVLKLERVLLDGVL
jgi:hypothetical protein